MKMKKNIKIKEFVEKLSDRNGFVKFIIYDNRNEQPLFCDYITNNDLLEFYDRRIDETEILEENESCAIFNIFLEN